MIAYFDTSGLVPLIIQESGSQVAARIWDEATHVVSVRVVYVEARAALAQARLLARLTTTQLSEAVGELDDLYAQIDRIEIDEALTRRGGELAQQYALRGYDAVHLAGAEIVADDDMVLVAGDGDLLQAARAHRIAVSPTTA